MFEEDKILSNQLLILIGQVIELKVEVALLRGMQIGRAVECAFEFLEGSPLLSELFDHEHLTFLKGEYLRHFVERGAAPILS